MNVLLSSDVSTNVDETEAAGDFNSDRRFAEEV